MTDKDILLSDLNDISEILNNNGYGGWCAKILKAIALLKEQEAVEPYSMNAERTYGICPKCGKIIFRYGNVEGNHYCGICGQAVKWE